MLASDFAAFTINGSLAKDAKKFNNIIRLVVLPVPVENVVIPALHLDLRITPWLLSAFQKQPQALDIKLASSQNVSMVANDIRGFTEMSLHVEMKSIDGDIVITINQLQALQQHLQCIVLYFNNVTMAAVDSEEVSRQVKSQYTNTNAYYASLLAKNLLSLTK